MGVYWGYKGFQKQRVLCLCMSLGKSKVASYVCVFQSVLCLYDFFLVEGNVLRMGCFVCSPYLCS